MYYLLNELLKHLIIYILKSLDHLIYTFRVFLPNNKKMYTCIHTFYSKIHLNDTKFITVNFIIKKTSKTLCLNNINQ